MLGRMTWTAPPITRQSTPYVADERQMLEAWLDFQRQTLLGKCSGLTAEQLRQRAAPPSTLSLLGLVRHMAKVERIWFRHRAAGEDVPPMYDPALGKDHDFEALDPADAPNAFARLEAEWDAADAAAARFDFDHLVEVHGEPFSLRMIYVHMIGEYARHNGHADLLREAIDGVTAR